MSKLQKADVQLCLRCKYHAGIGAQPGKEDTNAGHNHNIMCHYLKNTGHSRIFKHGELVYDPQYCDKFEEGKPNNIGWTSDDMGLLMDEDKAIKELRRILNEEYD